MPRLNPTRVPTRQLDPITRVQSFAEVDLDYTLEEALAEAARCIRCPRPACVEACPAHNAIPQWIGAFAAGRPDEAIEILSRTSTLPAVCSRLCDHARQCQGVCVVGKRGDPVAIGRLERHLADWAASAGRWPVNGRAAPTGQAVAVVGAGPAGLGAADALARAGHAVTVFEQLPSAGGLLKWAIPAFRLPETVVDEYVQGLEKNGVTFRFGERLGTDFTADDLLAAGYAAVFLGTGAWRPTTLGVPGEDLQGVYQALAFLARAKPPQADDPTDLGLPAVGRRVLVIGGGNTAMDAAATARRLGAEVTVVYRRSDAEMPARHEEAEGARAEGVAFRFLTAPTRVLGNAGGRVQALECVEMRLGEPDAGGRRRPLPVEGSEHLLEADTVVLALGFSPELAVLGSTPGLDGATDGRVTVDPATGRTSRDGVWAAGDLVTGPDTVVRAMARGRDAAWDIARWLAEGGAAQAPLQPAQLVAA